MSIKFLRLQKAGGLCLLRAAFFLRLLLDPAVFGRGNLAAFLAVDFCFVADDLGLMAKG